jgi:hypothetical protein
MATPRDICGMEDGRNRSPVRGNTDIPLSRYFYSVERAGSPRTATVSCTSSVCWPTCRSFHPCLSMWFTRPAQIVGPWVIGRLGSFG